MLAMRCRKLPHQAGGKWKLWSRSLRGRSEGELRTGDRKIRLQEQPFQILLMLVERSGGLVTREEIKKKLWPNDTVVEFDHSIHTAINKLRQAFGDSAENPKYIETVARRGYRLMVPVERASASPASLRFDVPAPPVAEPQISGLSGRRISQLSRAGTVGWWGHGRGVQGRRSEAGPPRGPEVSA
jgi:DNA-binding winged helix-turn-helix (wHTH) protein